MTMFLSTTIFRRTVAFSINMVLACDEKIMSELIFVSEKNCLILVLKD